MLDVHPPHRAIHGWKDFLLHLLTITIGLLLALTLEGWLEGRHRRHLLHEAEAGLETEIRTNANALEGTAAAIHKQQEVLKDDIDVLKRYIKTRNLPKGSRLDINFHITQFDDLSWKTAQSTGALTYMSYSEAKEFAEIYGTQEAIDAAQKQTVRDTVISMAPLLNIQDEGPTPEEAVLIKQHIEVLQGQLLVLDAMLTELGNEYKKYLAVRK